MSGIGDMIFGSDPETISTVDPYVKQQLLDPLTQQISQQLFGQGATEPNFLEKLAGFFTGEIPSGTPGYGGAFTGGEVDWAYPGQRVADTSTLQNQAFTGAENLGTQANALQSLGASLLGNSPNFAATKDYTGQLWNEYIAPNVMETFGGMGAGDSGGAMKALSRAGQQTALGLASQLAPMELQASQGAAALLPSLQQMGLDATNTQAALGTLQRGIGQEQLTSGQQAWEESQPWNHPLMQYLFPTANMYSTGITGGQEGLLSGALSGLGGAVGQGLGGQMATGSSLLGALGSIFSDRRLKENIRPIENAMAKIKGLVAHAYSYIGSDEECIGLIAQDVEKVLPEAVVTHNGYLMVNLYALQALIVSALHELKGARYGSASDVHSTTSA